MRSAECEKDWFDEAVRSFGRFAPQDDNVVLLQDVGGRDGNVRPLLL